MEEINATSAAIATFRTANRKVIERQEYATEAANNEALKTSASTQAVQQVNDRVREAKSAKDTLLQGYGHLPIEDDTVGYDIDEPTPGGSLRAPMGAPTIKKSELDAYDADIADAKQSRDKRHAAHEAQQRRSTRFTEAQVKMTREVSKLIATNPRGKLEVFESKHDLDDPSVDALKEFHAQWRQQAAVVDDLGKLSPPLTDDAIEALVGEVTAPFKLYNPSFAQRASSLLGSRPSLRWATAETSGAASLSPGIPATVEGDAVSIALWLARDKVVTELKRQAAELAKEHGTMTPAEHKAALRAAKAEEYRLELEVAAAWWRLREAGFDTLPPPVSGKALLLIL